MPPNGRSSMEKEILVDLIVLQLKKPSRCRTKPPRIDWRFVQQRFNDCAKHTDSYREASAKELNSLWKSLKDTALKKQERGDTILDPILKKVCKVYKQFSAKENKTVTTNATPRVQRQSKRKLLKRKTIALSDCDNFAVDEEELEAQSSLLANCSGRRSTKVRKRENSPCTSISTKSKKNWSEPQVPQPQELLHETPAHSSPKPATVTSATVASPEAVPTANSSIQTFQQNIKTSRQKESFGQKELSDTDINRQDFPSPRILICACTKNGSDSQVPQPQELLHETPAHSSPKPATVASAEGVPTANNSIQTFQQNVKSALFGQKELSDTDINRQNYPSPKILICAGTKNGSEPQVPQPQELLHETLAHSSPKPATVTSATVASAEAVPTANSSIQTFQQNIKTSRQKESFGQNELRDTDINRQHFPSPRILICAYRKNGSEPQMPQPQELLLETPAHSSPKPATVASAEAVPTANSSTQTFQQNVKSALFGQKEPSDTDTNRQDCPSPGKTVEAAISATVPERNSQMIGNTKLHVRVPEVPHAAGTTSTPRKVTRISNVQEGTDIMKNQEGATCSQSDKEANNSETTPSLNSQDKITNGFLTSEFPRLTKKFVTVTPVGSKKPEHRCVLPITSAQLIREDGSLGQRRVIQMPPPQVSGVKTLNATNVQNDFLLIGYAKELHMEKLRHERELHALRMKMETEIAERSKILHETKMMNEQKILQKTQELQDAKIQAMQLSQLLKSEISNIDKQIAILKQEEAATNNKIALLKLKQTELELKQLEGLVECTSIS